MGQQEVLQFLSENKGKWFSSKEISKELGISRGSIQCSLRKLHKQKEISIKSGKGMQVWYAVKIMNYGT